jgi:hypothetical protein
MTLAAVTRLPSGRCRAPNLDAAPDSLHKVQLVAAAGGILGGLRFVTVTGREDRQDAKCRMRERRHGRMLQ